MRILIHSNQEELDRNLGPVDYKALPNLKRKWGGNIGNKLFLTSMDVYCHSEGVEYEYLTTNMSAEYINSHFDLILWPLANCFAASEEILGYLKEYTRKLHTYTVPVLALGAGAQANSYDDINELINAIKPVAKDFIDAVHRTGGKFGLRGFFTEELFNKLGYYNDCVTGCPSMYQMGKNLHIEKKKLNDNFRLALNGNRTSMILYEKNDICKKYLNTWFVDQGDYVSALYEKKDKINIHVIRQMMDSYSKLGVKLLASNKIICIYDLPRLASYLQELKLDLSFGQRIHGNILCTLLGIPAIVYVHDSRTKELAEFFGLPIYEDVNGKIDILEAYEKADWTNFNNNFNDKYDNFEKLLIEYGMPPISQNKYTFLCDVDKYPMPHYVNDYSQIKKMVSNPIFWIDKK